jgi:hypothetical protein
MTGLAAWTALVLLPAVVGVLAWTGASPRAAVAASFVAPSRGTARLVPAFLAYLSGFALLSAGFFALAHVGRLSTGVASALVAVLVAGGAAVGVRRGTLGEAAAALPSAVAFGVALAVASSFFATVLPPLDATAAGSDGSIYIGAAHNLARTGRLTHHDALVAGMTVDEREALFRNRFPGDHTGRYARFPGGVSLASPTSDTVSFYFFHLFPVWLAVGLKTVGGDLYLRLMSLFACLGLASLFVVGRRIGGTGLGLLACLAHASFYPQAFFSRFPSSEILAQALFLSGLAALGGEGEGDGGADARHAHLAGWLWGALCLCRVDALPFLALGLALSSTLPARTGVRPRDWVVPTATTALFASAALLHQLSTSILYVGALPRSRLLAAAGAFVAQRPWLSGTGLALVVAVGVLLLRGDADGPRGARWRPAARLALLAASAAILGVFLSRLDPDLVARHVRWIAMYATGPVLLLLCVGFALALAFTSREAGARGTSLALSFLAGPALCYVVDPMVLALQPWAMRRFVPMVFPLLVLLAFRGWQLSLRRACGRHAGFAPAAFAALALVVVGTFLRSTARLAGPERDPGAAEQMGVLARAIPGDALILLPDASADLHFQLPLEYAHGRDVLLLPLAAEPDTEVEDAMRRLLTRQLAGGRRVCLLLPRPTDLPGPLLRHFDLSFRFETALSFASVRFVAPDSFPEPPGVVSLRSRVLDVQLPRAAAAASVRVGDPREDAGILVSGFYAPEAEVRPGQSSRPFRWTGPLARLAFPPGTAVVLTLDTSRPAGAAPARLEVDVDGVPVAVSLGEAGWQRLRISLPPLERAPRKRILSLRTNAFRMAALGLSPDDRDLGVRVVGAGLEP